MVRLCPKGGFEFKDRPFPRGAEAMEVARFSQARQLGFPLREFTKLISAKPRAHADAFMGAVRYLALIS